MKDEFEMAKNRANVAERNANSMDAQRKAAMSEKAALLKDVSIGIYALHINGPKGFGFITNCQMFPLSVSYGFSKLSCWIPYYILGGVTVDVS